MLAVVVGSACAAPRPAAPPRVRAAEAPLGAVHLDTSCERAVQPELDRAVALLHHMTYVPARAAFQEVLAHDPRCAMAEWGVAMTLFTPLWPTRPTPAELAEGWSAVEKARAIGAKTDRERRYVDAVASFFQDPTSTDYWARVERWEAAMKALHDAFPGDAEASTFYALALLASARPGPTTAQHSAQAVALLRPVLQRHPDHPGAMHYVIHANDIPGREHEDLDVVHRYEQIAPDNPHALHMPTHIYTRLGDWDGVVRGNLRAAQAALRFRVGESGRWVWDEYPHAIEYLVYAYLQQGADAEAKAWIERLLATKDVQPSAKTAFHLASTQARYTLERHAWREAAALVPREPALVDWDRFPWAEAVTWFARGYGSAKIGDVAEATRASARLVELERKSVAGSETVFARQIAMLRLMLDGVRAHAAHDEGEALKLLGEAVALEAATPKPPVTPAATLPASEVLGDVLLELGRADEALAAYRESLARFPRRRGGTAGVARALAAKGDGQR